MACSDRCSSLAFRLVPLLLPADAEAAGQGTIPGDEATCGARIRGASDCCDCETFGTVCCRVIAGLVDFFVVRVAGTAEAGAAGTGTGIAAG